MVGCRGVGRPETVTDREGMDVFLDEGGGMLEAVEVRRESGVEARLSADGRRVLDTGNAGKGPVGGGRGVRGSWLAEAMVLRSHMETLGGRAATVASGVRCSEPQADPYSNSLLSGGVGGGGGGGRAGHAARHRRVLQRCTAHGTAE